MKRGFKLVSVVLACAALLSPALGQSARKGPVGAKPAVSKMSSAQDRQQLEREAEAVAIFAALALSEQQLTIAQKVSLGTVACESTKAVQVAEAYQRSGKFYLMLGEQSYRMVPMVTDSGAVRLEDLDRGVVWLQLANKSMLLDQRQGRRLADGCMNDGQRQIAREMERNPASHLLSGTEGADSVKVAQQGLAR